MLRIGVWLLSALCTLIVPQPGWAAIAFDAFTGGTSGVSPKTVAHTVTTTGANTGVYALVFDNAANTVTGCTYNGTAMTLRANHSASASSIYEWIGTSTSGAKNVVCSATSGTLYLSIISFTGVSAFDASNNGFNFGTTPLNIPITTVAADCFAVAMLYDSGQSSTPTAGAGTTKAGANGDYSGIATFYSTASLGAAGAKNLVANVATAGNNNYVIVSFSPSGGGGGAETFGFRKRLQQ